MKEEQSKPAPEYLLGSPEQQSWMKKYFFSPRGLGFLEPGIVGLDDAKMSAYNVAKSSYQIRPDVFNMNYLSKTVGLGKEEIIQRMQRMYEQRTIVFVMNPAVSVYGWGLYYWMVKLNENTPPPKPKPNYPNGFKTRTISALVTNARGISISTTAII